MNRIKVINEPSELVPMLRSVDTPVKRDVLKEVTLEWRTADEIEKKYGPEGKDAIIFFEKMKLVESRWLSTDGNYPEKSFHTYYTSFHINAQWPVYEISDVLAAAMMSEEEYAGLDAVVRGHEPRGALVPGPTGLELAASVVRRAAELLRPGGLLLMEHGWRQGGACRALCRTEDWCEAGTGRDLAGRERFLRAVRR